MTKALVLIDIQNDYFPNGKYPLVGIEKAARNAADLLAYYRENNLPIIHIQHLELSKDAPFFVPDTEGVKINSLVNPQGDENLIQKNNPNSFLDTELKEKLDALSVNAIVLCGAMSHMCIDATARAALDLGLECIVVEDACATLDLEFKDLKIPAVQVHGSFMTALEDAGCEITDLSTHL